MANDVPHPLCEEVLVARSLAQRALRVMVFDYRGHGESEAGPHPSRLDLDVAAAATELLAPPPRLSSSWARTRELRSPWWPRTPPRSSMAWSASRPPRGGGSSWAAPTRASARSTWPGGCGSPCCSSPKDRPVRSDWRGPSIARSDRVAPQAAGGLPLWPGRLGSGQPKPVRNPPSTAHRSIRGGCWWPTSSRLSRSWQRTFPAGAGQAQEQARNEGCADPREEPPQDRG